jgi:hypothetical protein
MSDGGEPRLRLDVAVQYYQKALHAFSTLLMKPDSANSDEILASSIMLSRYDRNLPLCFFWASAKGLSQWY